MFFEVHLKKSDDQPKKREVDRQKREVQPLFFACQPLNSAVIVSFQPIT